MPEYPPSYPSSDFMLPAGNDLLSIVLDNISACVSLQAPDGSYLYTNPAMRDLLAHAERPEHPGATAAWRPEHPDGAPRRSESMQCLPLADGELHYFWTVQLPLQREDGHVYAWLSLMTDITARKRLEDELLALATTDGLTGLYNRRHFLDRAEQTLQRSRRYHEPLTVLMCDIDFFKHINDTFGHAVGDRALQQVAAIIRACLRDTDIAGRIGGEEFAILLLQSSLEQGYEAAERLRQTIEGCRIAVEDGQSVPLSISIGIATPAFPHETLATLLQHADQALYAAKRQGRNRVCLAA